MGFGEGLTVGTGVGATVKTVRFKVETGGGGGEGGEVVGGWHQWHGIWNLCVDACRRKKTHVPRKKHTRYLSLQCSCDRGSGRRKTSNVCSYETLEIVFHQ